MPKLDQFHSPANQAIKDFGADASGLKKFNQSWSGQVNEWFQQSILGNPWSNRNDDNRYYYFNPLTTDQPANPPAIPITWNPFPNRLFNFFQDPSAPASEQLTTEQIYQLADLGAIPIGGVATPIAKIQVPQQLCPNNNWKGPLIGYTPVGPRGWLDEYCEWSVKRDANGKLRQVMFTCENPAYWFTLWRVSPDLVTQLYQKYVNPNVKRPDLYLVDDQGQPVKDPLSGDYAYDPTNKWNRGTQTLGDRGGAIHLTSGPNTLSAEIYLAAAGTIARACGNTDAQTLICCASFGRPRRNSDPHIGQLANQAANAPGQNQFLTLADPVGLYIQTPNFQQWAVKGQPGYDVKSMWQVTRGFADPTRPGQGYDSILHAVFTVPDNLQPEDILITAPDGHTYPLQWAGQIAQTFLIALRVNAIAAAASSGKPVPQQPRACVVFLDNSAPDLQPWPVQLLPYDMMLAGSPVDLAPAARPGSKATMALVVQGGLPKASIEFSPADGIGPVTITKFLPNASAPGQTSGGDTQAYVFDLTIAANAPVGIRNIRVTNLDKQAPPGGVPWAPGFLNIGAA